MQEFLIAEWINLSLSESSTYSKISESIKEPLRNKMIKDTLSLVKDKSEDFSGTFLLKISGEIKKANWTWYLTRDWPYAKWEKIKKEVFSKTCELLHIPTAQTEMEVLNEEKIR